MYRSSVNSHDVVVVGARAAGAATALLLARAGLRVLVLDRTAYGADTVSTHALMRGGVLQLRRWGLLDAVVASGTPPVRHTVFQVGDERTSITIKPSYGVDALYAPRRTVLDRLLVDAAVAAGADVRHGVTVTGLTMADGRVGGVVGRDADGRPVSERARLVVGADGMSSNVARMVAAPVERSGAWAGAAAYGYWSDLPTTGYEWFYGPGVAAGVIPTTDGQTCVFVGTTPERFRAELVSEPLAGFMRLVEAAGPGLRERLTGADGPDRLRRFPGRRGHMRRAWGPGWALVGDAGYFKDPITAHGLTDALRDAELLARATVAALDGGDEAAELAAYQQARDELSNEVFAISDAVASYAWNFAEVGGLLRRLSSAMADEVATLAALDHDTRTPALVG